MVLATVRLDVETGVRETGVGEGGGGGEIERERERGRRIGRGEEEETGLIAGPPYELQLRPASVFTRALGQAREGGGGGRNTPNPTLLLPEGGGRGMNVVRERERRHGPVYSLQKPLPPNPPTEVEEEEEEEEDEQRDDFIVSTTSELLPFLWSTGYDTGTSRVPDYFHTADLVRKGLSGLTRGGSPLQPPRTYQCAENIVYHLTRDPAYSLKTINEIAQLYNIPDLPAAVGAFIFRITRDPSKGYIDSVGGRRNVLQDNLPVSHLQIWRKLRIQTTTYHHPHNKLIPNTINAAPPSPAWPYGQFDSVVFNVDPSKKWPQSGLKGKWEILITCLH